MLPPKAVRADTLTIVYNGRERLLLSLHDDVYKNVKTFRIHIILH